MQTINELRNSNLKNYENDYIVDNLIRENGLYAILGSTAIESCMDGCLCLTKNKDLDDLLYLNYIGRNYPSRKITLLEIKI